MVHSCSDPVSYTYHVPAAFHADATLFEGTGIGVEEDDWLWLFGNDDDDVEEEEEEEIGLGVLSIPNRCNSWRVAFILDAQA